eukprot:gene17414-23714_t
MSLFTRMFNPCASVPSYEGCRVRNLAPASSSRVPRVQVSRPTRMSSSQQAPRHIMARAHSYVPVSVVERLKEQEMEQLAPLPVDVEGLADDPSVHNPLQRMERLGTGWFSVILEYEGVVVESSWEVHTQAWLQVAEEFGYPKPLGHLFRRVRGCRDELVASRVFNWTQNPTTLRILAERKAEIFDELVAGPTGRQPAVLHEVVPFLKMMHKTGIPVALVCPLPKKRVLEALSRHGLADAFNVVVTAEDSGAPEVEYSYMYAAQRLERPPMRCVVVGESNTAVEAAHELGMKCVVPTGHKPVYDFVGADMVVRHLGQIAFLNLKKLFGQESLVRSQKYDELPSSPEFFSDEMEEQEVEEYNVWREEDDEE